MGPSDIDVRTFVPNIRVSKSLRNGIQLVWLVEFAVLQLSVLGTLDAARIRYQCLSSTFGFGSHDGKARPHEHHRGEGTLGPGCFPWNLHSYPEDSGGLAFEFLLSKLCICSRFRWFTLVWAQCLHPDHKNWWTWATTSFEHSRSKRSFVRGRQMWASLMVLKMRFWLWSLCHMMCCSPSARWFCTMLALELVRLHCVQVFLVCVCQWCWTSSTTPSSWCGWAWHLLLSLSNVPHRPKRRLWRLCS